jgi:putative intracellular protease/amidase
VKQQDAYLFVFDGLSDWEPGYTAAGINSPQFQINPGRYRLRTVALGRGSIATMGGIRIEPDLTLASISPENSAILILPGGPSWDTGHNMDAVEMAGTFLNSGVPVAAICGATAGLARGGLLDHRRHTSNAREYLAATGYRGMALYEDVPAVTDDNLITASGIAPIDFAQHIFRRLGLYTPQVLDAWYGLFKTGRAEYFGALMQAANA